jgi:hypothetical protein
MKLPISVNAIAVCAANDTIEHAEQCGGVVFQEQNPRKSMVSSSHLDAQIICPALLSAWGSPTHWVAYVSDTRIYR